MVRDSISKLEPALENRVAKHSSQVENVKELTGILATAIVMHENGLIVGRTASSGSGKTVSGGTANKSGASVTDDIVKAESQFTKGTAANSTSTSLKIGETRIINEVSVTRVGRWKSSDELVQMQRSGKVVQGGGGQTFISTNGASDFKGTASTGSVYVEFDVPTNSLLKGGKDGWFKLIVPDASKSQQFMLNKQGGTHLPEVKNISIKDKNR